ncbi:hypothetical protein DYY65_00360 [Nitrososphaera sp. AFS]|nr:hypothetical protein [Nitrososphaera sp. AFS]
MSTAGVMVRIYFRYPNLDTFLKASNAKERIVSSKKIFLDSTRSSYVSTGHFSVVPENDFFTLSSDVLLQRFRIVWSTLRNCQIFNICTLACTILVQSNSQISTYEIVLQFFGVRLLG